MRLLYIDASGNGDWPPPVGKSPSKYYVLVGLAIEPDKWDVAYAGVTQLIAKYFPNPNKRPVELHYAELIARKGAYGLLSSDQRLALANEVFAITKSVSPTIFAIVVDKLKHYQRYKTPEMPNQLSLRFLAAHFSKFLQHHDDHGLMIYDATEARSDRFLRGFISRAQKEGLVLQTWEDPFRTQNKLEGIIESVFFIESELSPVVQLADFCAYAVFSKYEHGKDDRFKEIAGLIDRNDGQLWGLVEWSR